jgi:hypothetical protein
MQYVFLIRASGLLSLHLSTLYMLICFLLLYGNKQNNSQNIFPVGPLSVLLGILYKAK